MKGLRRRIRSGQDKKMLEGADICIKSQSPPAAFLYMCHVLHKMKSQSPAVQLQRPPVQSPAEAVAQLLYTVQVQSTPYYPCTVLYKITVL